MKYQALVSKIYNLLKMHHQKILPLKQSPYRSKMQRDLSKNRKYYFAEHNNKENILKQDVQTLMTQLVEQKLQYQHSCSLKLSKDRINYQLRKIDLHHNHHQINFFPPSSHKKSELKTIKRQLSRVLSKLRPLKNLKTNDYQEYLKLSQQSFDYLQFYLKNRMGQEQEDILKSTDKRIILSMLKNYYPCFTENPFEISNRIMLSFHLNPLNDFHFISWQTFLSIKRFISGVYTRAQCKQFFINYIFLQNQSVTTLEFWSIIGAVLHKLEKVINKSNTDIFIERVCKYGDDFFTEQTISRQKLMKVMNKEPLFVWQELIQLIFTV